MFWWTHMYWSALMSPVLCRLIRWYTNKCNPQVSWPQGRMWSVVWTILPAKVIQFSEVFLLTRCVPDSMPGSGDTNVNQKLIISPLHYQIARVRIKNVLWLVIATDEIYLGHVSSVITTFEEDIKLWNLGLQSGSQHFQEPAVPPWTSEILAWC